MSPSNAGGAVVGAITEVILADRILRDGEQIILVVKPSAWFIVLRSGPVLLLAGLLALLAATLLDEFLCSLKQLVLLASCLMAVAQLTLSCLRWFGRLYVLTDRRILRLRGALRVDVFDCELPRILDVQIVRSGGERLLGLGSLTFRIEGNPYVDPGWINLDQPQVVLDEVQKAIRHAKHRSQRPLFE